MTVATDSRVKDVQAELDRLTTADGIERVPGISMGILDGDELHVLVSGSANGLSGETVRPRTLFRIASITKTYTATLVMQLADQGRVDLDRPLVEQLPEFRLARPDDTQAVTPRHLLTHTSGISGDLEFPPGRGDDALQKWVARLADADPLFSPGVTHSYSNAGYNVLGRLVEYVLGMTWEEALRDKITAPLGLQDTVTFPEEVLPKLHALGHRTDVESGELTPIETWDADRGSAPCGEISASAPDLMAFARMYLDGGAGPNGTRLLSADAAASMRTPQITLPRYSISAAWGLGFELFASGDELIPGHGGNVDAQTSALYLVPERHAALCVLTNSDRGSIRVQPLVRRVLDEWFGVRLAPDLEPPDTTPDVPIEPYLGIYDRGDLLFDVARTGGDLTLTITDRLGRMGEGEPQSYDLVPCSEEGVFLMMVPGVPRGMPVVFERWGEDQRLFMHAGGRSTPKAESGTGIGGLPLEKVTE
jgi:CubicO group peptidase (beta-lactamase class C family)